MSKARLVVTAVTVEKRPVSEVARSSSMAIRFSGDVACFRIVRFGLIDGSIEG